MVCQVQGMFPKLVKFEWKDSKGINVQPSEGGDELLEQINDEESQTTSMLIVDQTKVTSGAYSCLVKHEAEPDPIPHLIPTGTTVIL